MSPDQTYNRANLAIRWSFLFMGLPIGTLIPRLAEIKSGVSAANGSYGTAIAIGGLGAMLGNYLGNQLVHKYGSRFVAQSTFVFILISNISNALAPSVSWLAVVAFAGGLTYSVTNIAMNTQGIIVEQGIGRSFLPRGHAYWSIGAMTAAVVSSLAAPLCTPLQALLIMNFFSLIGFLIMSRGLLSTQFDDQPQDDPAQLSRHEKIPRTALRFLFIISVGQWLAVIAEISVGDWSSVLLHEHFNIAIGPNGYGFATFMIVQLVTRLRAPKLIDKHGLDTVVRTFGIIGGTGYLLGLALATNTHESNPQLTLIFSCVAYAFIGLGVATMPAAFVVAAGRIPGLPSARALMVTGVAISLMNVISRIAFAYISQIISLPLALTVMGLALFAASKLAYVLHPEKAQEHAIQR